MKHDDAAAEPHELNVPSPRQSMFDVSPVTAQQPAVTAQFSSAAAVSGQRCSIVAAQRSAPAAQRRHASARQFKVTAGARPRPSRGQLSAQRPAAARPARRTRSQPRGHGRQLAVSGVHQRQPPITVAPHDRVAGIQSDGVRSHTTGFKPVQSQAEICLQILKLEPIYQSAKGTPAQHVGLKNTAATKM